MFIDRRFVNRRTSIYQLILANNMEVGMKFTVEVEAGRARAVA